MADNVQETYQELAEKMKKASLLASAAGVLNWDERTYMPRAGVEFRANQLSLLSGMVHEMATSAEIDEMLKRLENSRLMADENSPEAVNIRELRRAYDKQAKLSKELVEELAATRSRAQNIWGEARRKSDFSIFKEILAKVVELTLRMAEQYGYETEPYDALLDDYEPRATAAEIEKVFAALREDLVPFVDKIINSGKRPNLSLIEADYDVARQRVFGQEAAAAIGFDFSGGRLDETTHPFCTGLGPGDVRILTRYNPRDFADAFFGILHEAGHGMYEQGLPRDKYFGLPMAESISLGIHESQSRTWENLVGRGKPFWKHFFPRAQQVFPERLAGVKFEDFYFAINDVKPSFIRVEADEVTYNLHIILRFEIERAIVKKEIKPIDIPAFWNEKFTKFFGLTPPDDARGCLQDVHWSAGLIGYFPTYALGNLYSAQFFRKAQADHPEMEQQFERGDFSTLKNWFSKNIYAQGKRYSATKLVEVVTGQPLSHKPWMEYIRQKYSELYL